MIALLGRVAAGYVVWRAFRDRHAISRRAAWQATIDNAISRATVTQESDGRRVYRVRLNWTYAGMLP